MISVSENMSIGKEGYDNVNKTPKITDKVSPKMELKINFTHR